MNVSQCGSPRLSLLGFISSKPSSYLGGVHGWCAHRLDLLLLLSCIGEELSLKVYGAG
jgi:hypothetical protein